MKSLEIYLKNVEDALKQSLHKNQWISIVSFNKENYNEIRRK